MAQPADFPVHLTDGNSQHTPGAQPNDYISAYDLTLEVHALFAKAMMKIGGNEVQKGIYYTKIPDGYSVWVRQRGGGGNNGRPKYDYYIFGHPKLKTFDSFRQFATHIDHIQQLDLAPEACPCKVCKKRPLDANDIIRRERVPARLVTP